MKLMLKFAIPVQKGNGAFADGSMGPAIERLLADLQPEAAYFMLTDGERSGLIFFEESDGARIPQIVEPFFAALEAAIDVVPVLTAEELKRTLGGS